jgi:hypothetical protein
MLGKQRRGARPVGQVKLDEAERRKLCQFGEPRLFERRIVIGTEIIDPNYRPSGLRQPPCDMKADKSRGPGDQNTIRHLYVPNFQTLPHASKPPQFYILGPLGTIKFGFHIQHDALAVLKKTADQWPPACDILVVRDC